MPPPYDRVAVCGISTGFSAIINWFLCRICTRFYDSSFYGLVASSLNTPIDWLSKVETIHVLFINYCSINKEYFEVNIRLAE
jgi:hypothetical protein